jgi:hypothetical protein
MRRSRFEVTMLDGSCKAVLAYDAAGASSFYQRRGYNVAHVAKVRPRRGRAQGWSLDAARLAEVIEFFGLRLPVYVRFTTGVTRGGTHCLKAGRLLAPSARRRAHNGRVTEDRLYHHVTLSRAWTAEAAGRAVWHELAHAMQAERTILAHGLSFADMATACAVVRADDARSRSYGYRERPIEIEARSYEQHAQEINPCR